MRRILASRARFVREDGVDKGELVQRFRAEHQPYKLELVEGLPDGDISLYRRTASRICAAARTCRRPSRSRPSSCSRWPARTGAATPANPMLTRIYGTAFFEQADSTSTSSGSRRPAAATTAGSAASSTCSTPSDSRPGAPFWHPRGMVIWNELTKLWRELNRDRGYREVRTPIIFAVEVWKQLRPLGQVPRQHVLHREGRARRSAEADELPRPHRVYQAAKRSYRDLPMRLAEQGLVHRDEPSGTLHGLLRVIHITQDDAHIFCTDDQVRGRGDRLPGAGPHDLRHLRPDRCSIELLDPAREPDRRRRPLGPGRGGARAARSQRAGAEYELNEGDGAFYGPKIDLHMNDALGRSWQMGTIQLDYQMPERFDLAYTGDDNAEHRPAMIHRALFGAFERFIGILIEHFAGAFPLWLAPVQAMVLPVADRHDEYA